MTQVTVQTPRPGQCDRRPKHVTDACREAAFQRELDVCGIRKSIGHKKRLRMRWLFARRAAGSNIHSVSTVAGVPSMMPNAVQTVVSRSGWKWTGTRPDDRHRGRGHRDDGESECHGRSASARVTKKARKKMLRINRKRGKGWSIKRAIPVAATIRAAMFASSIWKPLRTVERGSAREIASA